MAAAARKIGNYDLLLFGRMTTDGDTAQVGPEVAALAGIPQVTRTIAISRIDERRIEITKRAAGRRLQLSIELPCALMVSRENGTLDLPTLNGCAAPCPCP